MRPPAQMTGKDRRPAAPARAAPRPSVRPSPAAAPRTGAGLAIANRVAFYLVLAFFAFLVLYITYELGRYNGSYDRLAVSQLLSERDVQIEHLEADNRAERTKLEEQKTIDVGHPKEVSELQRNIRELQTQVASLSQELTFYKGVMAKPPAELGVRLGEVHVVQGRKPGTYMVHVGLVRAGRTDDTVQGSLTLHIDSDKGKVLDLADLTGGKLKNLPYDFRFYTNIDQVVTIPDGFKPLHLGLDLQSAENVHLAQTYVWAEIGGDTAPPPPSRH